jgi:hypothetical protein
LQLQSEIDAGANKKGNFPEAIPKTRIAISNILTINKNLINGIYSASIQNCALATARDSCSIRFQIETYSDLIVKIIRVGYNVN